MLPANDANLSFINSSPSLPLRQRAPPAPPTPLSLVDDPTFKTLYANNEIHLRHFLANHDALPHDGLKTLFEHIKTRNEPGQRVQYGNLAFLLTAMRSFLGPSTQGEKLVTYFRTVLRIQGCYIVTTADVLAYELVVKMIQALFVFQNDQQLYNHICEVVPDALPTIKSYTAEQRNFFVMYAADKSTRLHDDNVKAINSLVGLKASKEFSRKHRQLLKAHEIHELKLVELRKKDAQRKADRKARIQTFRARNDANLRRQMGMNGLTPLTQHVTHAVVDFVEEVSEDFFPREDNEVYSEQHMLQSLITAD